MTEDTYRRLLGRNISACIRVKRKLDKRITQAWVAAQIGKDAGQFSKMLTCKDGLKVHDEDLPLIASTLGVPPESLIPRDEIESFPDALSFEIAWLKAGGGPNDSDLGRRAQMTVLWDMLNADGQRAALTMLKTCSLVPEYKKVDNPS